MDVPTPYEEHIITAFETLCKANAPEGASPSEVTQHLAEHGQLAELDTVIDVERIMKSLRAKGRL